MTTPLSGEWAEFDGKLYHFEMPISVSPYSKGSPITTNTTLEKDVKKYFDLKQIDDRDFAGSLTRFQTKRKHQKK